MRLIDGMVCPVCESGKMRLIKDRLRFVYKGHPQEMENVDVFHCQECGEGLLDDRTERIVEKKRTDFRKKIDGLLTSDEIREIRKQFNLSQVEFARLLKVGEKNFARYEAGMSTQNRSMDLLLRILGERPEVIEIVSRDFKKISVTG